MKLLFSCLMLLMFFSLIFSAHAQVSTGNEIGTANLDKDKISVSHHVDDQVKIYGTISEPARGTKITILITDPNGDTDPSSQQIFTTDVGYFETFKILNWESLRGTYTVLVSSDNKIIGSLLFVVQESGNYTVNVQTPKQITHDTVLTLNLETGTNPDSIRVFPKYIDESGNKLSFTINDNEEFIETYVDNQYVKSVKPNQWSDDITVGYGSHNVYVKSPEFTITGNVDGYLSAESNSHSISLKPPTTSELVAELTATTPSIVVDQTKVTIPIGSSSPGCETSNACYLPASSTINVGDTVEWKNTDTAAHTVTSGSPSDGPSDVFDSSLIMAGASFENTFDAAGSYDYFCMIHPWMVGNVQVNGNSQIVSLGTNSIEVIENRLVTLGNGGTHGSSTYLWDQIDGEHVTLSSYNVAEPQFMAPEVANGQIKVLTFTYAITNPLGTSNSETVVVVNPVNHNPMVDAGKDQDIFKTVNEITLVSSAWDPDGDSLTYNWTQVSGQSIKLSNTHGQQITILSNKIDYSQNNPLTFKIIVNDGFGGSVSDTVSVHPIPAKSNTHRISSQPPTVLSGTQDQSIFILLGIIVVIIVVIVIIVVVIIMNRRKISRVPGGAQKRMIRKYGGN